MPVRSVFLSIATVFLLSNWCLADEPTPLNCDQYHGRIRVFVGDPFGSVEEGTAKCVLTGNVCTNSKQPGTLSLEPIDKINGETINAQSCRFEAEPCEAGKVCVKLVVE